MQQFSEKEERPIEIVGVARDAKYRYISSGRHFIYVPMEQEPTSDIEFYRQARARPAMAQEIRTAMAQVEPNVPIVHAAIVR